MGKNEISESPAKYNKGPTLAEVNLPEATKSICSLDNWLSADV